jgi:UDP-glucuronate decarboxylase
MMNGTDDAVTGPVNIGNPAEFTIVELAREVIARTRSRSQLVMRALPSDDPKQRQPDIRLARELLDWEAKVPLAAGLDRTIDYFRDLLQAESAH